MSKLTIQAVLAALILSLAMAFPQSTSSRTVHQRPQTSSSTQMLTTLRGGQQDQDFSDQQSTLSSARRSLVVPSALASFGKFYESVLAQRPIVTKSITAGIVFGLSDYSAQKLQQQRANKNDQHQQHQKINWTRCLSCASVGLLYFGPAAHYWYKLLFHLLPATTLSSTLQKAVLGQVIFGPAFTCVFFGAGLAQAGNFSLRRWVQKIRTDLFGAWLAGVGFWPIVDLISFTYVPVTYIPLFVNICSFVWTIYLSLVANQGTAKTA
jgi:protein Mpv17